MTSCGKASFGVSGVHETPAGRTRMRSFRRPYARSTLSPIVCREADDHGSKFHTSRASYTSKPWAYREIRVSNIVIDNYLGDTSHVFVPRVPALEINADVP